MSGDSCDRAILSSNFTGREDFRFLEERELIITSVVPNMFDNVYYEDIYIYDFTQLAVTFP